ncbi:MAG: DUF4331 family protein [Phenylobacterium sp.]|uniref:DUF4331 family protein n=1 Tax=Phenylobacterium sp. TaxID=1871053 RepID=UPI001A3AEAD9|nr:DUF4331 family protein [Phenylobacterium sp.]MBL8554553.1 DUF4331 family protein [Phenylobacterium sp.]
MIRRQSPAIAAALGLPLLLCACSGGSGADVVDRPSTAPASASLNVQNCIDQPVRPGGPSVGNLVVPDTIKVDLTQPAGFPNGRRLTDSVIDTELAWIFLDLTRHDANTLAQRQLGPQANDVAFRSDFPYLAAPHGGAPAAGAGSNFNFRTDPASAYVQVDRMGMPAIATALISSSAKNAYNDDSPAIDGTVKYVNEITSTLAVLANALQDDFQRLGLSICARPVG